MVRRWPHPARSIFCFGRVFDGWINERPVRLHTGARRKLCRIDLVVPHDVHDRNTLHQEIVCNDAPVAAPPHSFGAHDGAAIVTGKRSQLIQSGSESIRSRVIGIVPEGGNLPECVDRRWRSLFQMPPSAKSRQLPIAYSGISESFG